MELTPYIYMLSPDLIDTGSCVTVEDTYALKRFDKGVRTFTLEDGISFRLTLTNVGGGVSITGTAEVVAFAECDRCLETARLEVSGEVETYAVFDPATLPPGIETDEYVLADGPEGCIDLASALFSAIILALPLVVLCKEDCAGICPACGAHLNSEACLCTVAPINDNHPFAVLKDLF